MSDSVKKRATWLQLTSFAIACLLFLGYLFTAPQTKGHLKDFGSQWMAARIIVNGDGNLLYDVEAQTQILNSEQLIDPDSKDRNLQNVDDQGSELGRLPYPPTQALIFAPLGFLAPQPAQQAMVYLSLLCSFLTALLLWEYFGKTLLLSTIWAFLMIQPAFFSTIALGQNAALTLLMLVAGMWLQQKQAPFWAGICLGLLSYKPTWLVAVAWLPLIAGGLRMYGGMAVASIGLALVTLPFTGWEAWSQWLQLAREFEAAEVSRWDWIRRDVRVLLQQLGLLTNGQVASALVLTLFPGLTWLAVQRGPCRQMIITLIFSGLLLSCLRFMWYDLLISSPAWLAAFSNWQGFSWKHKVGVVSLTGLYLAPPLVLWSDWPEVIALETLAVLGLWGMALSSSCSAAVSGSTSSENSLGPPDVPPV